MAQRSLLVIDDDKTWRTLIVRFLGGAAYKIYTAATCAEGVRLAKLHKPDCVLLDFHLTDGDAVSVCAALRANKDIKTTPVIIVSSDPEAEIAAYGECRAAGFLLKGSEPLKKLTGIVEKILRPGFSARTDD